MRSISTVTENWIHLKKKKKGTYLILDSFCPVFHHQLWKMNISVKLTSKGAFDAYHQPWLIVGKLLQQYIHKKKNLMEMENKCKGFLKLFHAFIHIFI